MSTSRRSFLRLLTLPAGAWLAGFRSLTAAYQGKVKITAVKAMQIQNIAGNCLIKVETDQGLIGYGESGVSGPMMRARLKQFEPMLVGKDPLTIEKHFLDLITLMHPYMAHIPSISGIDIALWDLAGKITGLPVNILLGGPFRDAIAMYSHGRAEVGDLQDLGQLRDWAAMIKAAPEGFTAYKIGVDKPLRVRSARYTGTIDGAQLKRVAQGYANCREAVGDEIDIAVHCHNELDPPSAARVCQAVEPMRPFFVEDPLPVHYTEGWQAVREATQAPLLVGEKLELVQGFRPFVDRGIADYLHPDLAFAGGITGTKKIADYALLSRRPVALHNVGSLILCYASAHFGSGIHNFFRSESALGRPTRHVEQMSTEAPPLVRDGHLRVPDGPGLGFVPNDDYLRSQMMDGEPWWG